MALRRRTPAVADSFHAAAVPRRADKVSILSVSYPRSGTILMETRGKRYLDDRWPSNLQRVTTESPTTERCW